MSENATKKPPARRHEDRPAPGFEVLSEEDDYVVTYEDIEKRPELEGVVLIQRATFGKDCWSEQSYYVSTYSAIVNLEEWDPENGSSCPYCGSVQAIHNKGGNGFNASFERIVCAACDSEIHQHLRT